MRREEIVKGGYYLKGNKVFQVTNILPIETNNPIVYYIIYDQYGRRERKEFEDLYYFAWRVERRVQPKKNPIDKAIDDYTAKMSLQRYQETRERYK